jgi:hypothetical protein
MSLNALFQTHLPINRKEVYYTATVLPCIVCADGFTHIHRFWKLLGIDVQHIEAAPDRTNVQFFTEYNARQSVYVETDKDRFEGEILSGETPDILIVVDRSPPLIISIEAKMYDTVSADELNRQFQAQYDNVLRRLLVGVPGAEIVQVALLPRGMPIKPEEIPHAKLLHWERIADDFSGIPSAAYFCDVLRIAVANYGSLQSKKLVFHANMDTTMLGEEILNGYEAGSLNFQSMGRRGGLSGADLAGDMNSGKWRRCLYEVSDEQNANRRNWFSIEEFVTKVRGL